MFSSGTPSLSNDWQSSGRWPSEDAYATIEEKAAAYGFFIAENQPFVDGNKRTAAAALATFLDVNDYELLEQSDTELAEIFEALGKKEIGQGEFFSWVINHAWRR